MEAQRVSRAMVHKIPRTNLILLGIHRLASVSSWVGSIEIVFVHIPLIRKMEGRCEHVWIRRQKVSKWQKYPNFFCLNWWRRPFKRSWLLFVATCENVRETQATIKLDIDQHDQFRAFNLAITSQSVPSLYFIKLEARRTMSPQGHYPSCHYVWLELHIAAKPRYSVGVPASGSGVSNFGRALCPCRIFWC